MMQARLKVKQVQIQILLLLLTPQCRVLDMTIGMQEEFMVQVEFIVAGNVVEGMVEDQEQQNMTIIHNIILPVYASRLGYYKQSSGSDTSDCRNIHQE